MFVILYVYALGLYMSLFSLSTQFSYNGYPVYKVSPHEYMREGRFVMRMIYIPDVDVHGRSPDIQAKLYANSDLLDVAVFAVYEANMEFFARLSSPSPLSIHDAKAVLTMTVDRLVGEGVPPDMQERMNVFSRVMMGGRVWTERRMTSITRRLSFPGLFLFCRILIFHGSIQLAAVARIMVRLVRILRKATFRLAQKLF